MQKTNDKFCPDCGHHLYSGHESGTPYCAECQDYYDESAVRSFDDVAHLRESYDTQAEEM